MGGHIVGAFVSVLVVGRIFGNQYIEVTLKIYTYRGIGVFVERQARRGVVNENVSQTNVEFP